MVGVRLHRRDAKMLLVISLWEKLDRSFPRPGCGMIFLLPQAGAVSDVLRDGLTAPLSGMGIAFSSSLFGLAGSLVLGSLDLQMSEAQNRF